jgi:hypothetical protein
MKHIYSVLIRYFLYIFAGVSIACLQLLLPEKLRPLALVISSFIFAGTGFFYNKEKKGMVPREITAGFLAYMLITLIQYLNSWNSY